jgi:hypothetical protein
MYLAADSGVELWEATTNGGTLWIDADSDGDGDGVFSLSDEGYGGIDTTGPGGGGVSITAASNMIAVDTLVLDAATSIGSTNSVMLDTNHVSAELTSESGGGPINLTETDSTSVSNFDAGQGTVTLGGGAFLVTDSTADQSTIHVNSGAALGGRGVVGGPVDVDSGGTVAPGLSPGILGTGSIAFDAGSMFQVELNGNTPGPGAGGYDQRHSCIRDSYDGSPKPSFGAQKQRKDRAVGLHRR